MGHKLETPKNSIITKKIEDIFKELTYFVADIQARRWKAFHTVN